MVGTLGMGSLGLGSLGTLGSLDNTLGTLNLGCKPGSKHQLLQLLGAKNYSIRSPLQDFEMTNDQDLGRVKSGCTKTASLQRSLYRGLFTEVSLQRSLYRGPFTEVSLQRSLYRGLFT